MANAIRVKSAAKNATNDEITAMIGTPKNNVKKNAKNVAMVAGYKPHQMKKNAWYES
jgi:hypothetical protein